MEEVEVQRGRSEWPTEKKTLYIFRGPTSTVGSQILSIVWPKAAEYLFLLFEESRPREEKFERET